MSIIYAFVKIFEEKKYADDFINGKLFMNTIRTFKEYKDKAGELRGDEYEGIVSILQPNKLKEINFGDTIISARELATPVILQMDCVLNKNAFCLYSLNSSGYDFITEETFNDFKRTLSLHESCFGLGKYCVVVLNAQEFINRCHNTILKNNLIGKMGLVEYFDDREFHGHFPESHYGFHKRKMFSHQREYRVLIDSDNNNPRPYVLDIGNLSNIAVLTTPEEFNRQLEIKLPKNPEI